MKTLFGTDGIRGKVNDFPMTSDIIRRVGQAVGFVLKSQSRPIKAVIGRDTRESGSSIENDLTQGMLSSGADVVQLGVIPTPGVAFLSRQLKADCGIVISASHNPYQDNGIKLFSSEGLKLSDQKEKEIEDLILADDQRFETDQKKTHKRVIPNKKGRAEYLQFLKKSFPEKLDLKGLNLVIDCAHGAAFEVAPDLFRELGASVRALHIEPDGRNINRDCGSTHPGVLQQEVIGMKADLGLAFDGDGDRVIAVDEKGRIVSGDKIIAICCQRLLLEGRLKNNCVVHTVMSNMGLSAALAEMGVKGIQTQVGDRYVMEAMQESGAVLGGEDSGHIIFLDHHTTGDGLISALQLLETQKKTNSNLSKLAAIMTEFPQILLNIEVTHKPDLDSIPEIKAVIEQEEESLQGRGRVLVRYSGTQNLCRIMVEGPTREVTEASAQKIAEVVRNNLND
jgi:phosphoglucosamine mutase